jgi:ubiquitin carboxyl-terminal hydrolase 4/11
MESTASASSRKRSASEDPTASSPVTRSTRLADPNPSSLSDPTSNDIDAYMNSQGESDVLQSTLLPVPHHNDPSLPDPNTEDALSSTLLRFQAIEIMRDMPLIEGSTWALVSKAWWRRFEKAATGQVDKQGSVDEEGLGPVDNSSLLDTDGCLDDNLVEGVDFDCIPEVVWDWLVHLYVLLRYQIGVLLTPSIQIWRAPTNPLKKTGHHSRDAKRTIHRAASATLPLLPPY